MFRMTGGQSVDTSNTPPQTGDFSQAGPGSIDTDEVDPVAEADVYMAYGRDAQAEEILLEALQKDPNRIAIHAKLLEIYANRKSVKQFETLASELYAQTAGVGPEWAKVAALGVGLDPANPLYSGMQRQAPAFNADATLVVSPEAARMAAQFVPEEEPLEIQAQPVSEVVDTFEIDTHVLPDVAPPEADVPVDEPIDDVMGLDFDLGAPVEESLAFTEEATAPVVEAVAEVEAVADVSDALDFDLGSSVAAAEPVASIALPADEDEADGLDFNLDLAVPPEEESSESLPDFSPGGTLVMPSMGDLDDLNDLVVPDAVAQATQPEQSEVPPVDAEPLVPETPEAAEDVAKEFGTDTVVNAMSLDEAVEVDNPSLKETIVSSGLMDEDAVEFNVSLTDSVFLGQPATPEFDIGSINLDLSAEAPPEALIPAPAQAVEMSETPEAAPVSSAQWEEVNTKLDLAKAYEEMGDLEGARELLQEVASEGPVDLVEQAREILARIGG